MNNPHFFNNISSVFYGAKRTTISVPFSTTVFGATSWLIAVPLPSARILSPEPWIIFWASATSRPTTFGTVEGATVCFAAGDAVSGFLSSKGLLDGSTFR